MDMTKYAGNESDWLRADDIEGKNVKVVIESVGEIHFDATDKQAAQDKGTLRFVGHKKGMVLNTTNAKTLIKAYGKDSDKWVGKEIGLNTKEYDGYADGIVVIILDEDFDDDFINRPKQGFRAGVSSKEMYLKQISIWIKLFT